MSFQVMGPKVHGAYLLHKLTMKDPVRFFVTFSSISSVLGAMFQANYSAANSYLEALVRYRRGKGLPGLCIQWGPVSDIGVVSRDGILIMKMSGAVPVVMVTPSQVLATFFTTLAAEVQSADRLQVWYPGAMGDPVFIRAKEDSTPCAVYCDEPVVLCAAINWRGFENVFRRHGKSHKFVEIVKEARESGGDLKSGGGSEVRGTNPTSKCLQKAVFL